MKMDQRFIPYNKQCVSQEDLSAVAEALTSDVITRGPYVEEFERAVAEYCGAKYGVAFNSGTSALLSACYAAGITKGDRVISTPNTFVSTVGSPVHCGATPVFVDIDLKNGAMNLDQAADEVNQPISRGKNIVMPVHFAGIPVDMEALNRKIATPNAIIIEDAAHAIGSSYCNGEKVGSCFYSDMTIFSFHPVKNITTGEGGMVTTNNEQYYQKLKLCRNNGIVKGFADSWYYEVHALTGNLNITDFQAALGLSQLKKLDAFADKRRKLINHYRSLIKKPFTMLTDAYDQNTAFHLNVVLVDFDMIGMTRTQFMEKLHKKGVGTQYHYIPVYRHPVFRKICGELDSYFPNMETYYAQALSLPLYVDMTTDDVEYVVNCLQD